MADDALISTAAVPRRVARVAVDVPLPHLDRPFDYEVPAAMDADCRPGVRVRVRFAGRLRDGFVLERADASDVDRLAPLERVVSAEPVLKPAVARLIRKVADHYAGTFADVMRLAVVPRHATTEKATPRERPDPDAPRPHEGPLVDYPTGSAFVDAVAAGNAPRAAWSVAPVAGPVGDWALGLAQAAAAARASGRGALLLAPDHRDLEQLAAACATVLGAGTFVVMNAQAGPAARYRAFLAAERGDVDVVIGTRAAVFAPVRDLGLIGLWDDGDDLWAEPRAPYPHAREVACLRATEESAALLLAAHARTAEVAALVERGWLGSLALPPAEVRRVAPVVRAAVDSDTAVAKDPAARAARLPHAAFEALRVGLAAGPVLVQVPRAGYRTGLVCQDCRTPARCPVCHGPLDQPGAGSVLRCGWCARQHPRASYRCVECGSNRLRATRVGAERTAVELGRAFPRTPLVSASGTKPVTSVGDQPSLVVTTPGAEPVAATGYAAAVLLDADIVLQRPDLRAGEEALRRWANAAALVRPAADGGTVVIVGPASARAVQALVRLDPAGFAARELADRREAGFPPAIRLVSVEGPAAAIAQFQELARLPETAEALGPVELPPAPGPSPDAPLSRLTLRAPLGDARALVTAVKQAVSVRSARKDDGALRVRVDPAEL